MKDTEPYAKLLRPISKYLTWVFIKLRFTANEVTMTQIATGVVGSFNFAVGNFMIGVICLQIGFILDLCDGEVARHFKQESKAGEYLDLIGHRIVIPLYFCGLGFGTGYILFGILAGLFSQKFVNLGESHTQKQGIKWFFLYPGSMIMITIAAIFGGLEYLIIFYGITIPIGRVIQINRTFRRIR